MDARRTRGRGLARREREGKGCCGGTERQRYDGLHGGLCLVETDMDGTKRTLSAYVDIVVVYIHTARFAVTLSSAMAITTT